MRKLTIFLTVLAAFGLLASVAIAQESVTVTLSEQNDSGQSGTATLTAMGDQTEVVIDTNGWGPAGEGVAQPVHIHAGTCADLGGVDYPLTNLEEGDSTTVVDAKLSDLQTGDFAINAHKSADEISVYTACGNIPAAAMLPTTGSSSSAVPAALVLAAGALILAGGLIFSRRAA